MTMPESVIEEHAKRLSRAVIEKESISPISEQDELTVADAYRIQEAVIERIQGDADELLGYKLGLVSAAKQEQLGIDEPIYCAVPQSFELDGHIPASDLISPRVEAELGLVLGADLEPPIRTIDVLTNTAAVVPVLEILESRFEEWAIPTAQDVIADITSGCGVVLGERTRAVTDIDLAMEGVIVQKNGTIVETGLGADILGHPARGVPWLANRLADRDRGLGKGDLVMTGGITAAVDIEPGDVVSVEFSSLGAVTAGST